jgi:ATP-dependent RNA helicase RhlE
LTFDTLGLMPESLRAVADQGYTVPTPVQVQAIPVILGGRDLLAGAQTGTGKTAAFVLPMLQTLHKSRPGGPRRVRGLVVVPTRELALQVEQSIRTYGVHRPIRSVAIYGGVRMDRQVRALRNGAEIVVATPGRLLDHVRQRTVDLRQVEILVLDEADRMLDMGFIHDIKRILEQLPKERQSLLFSATFSPKIRGLAQELLDDPESIDVAPRNTPAAPIRQVVHPVDKGQKRHLLTHMVRTKRVDQVLVFTRTKRGANRLAEQLGKDGIDAAAIHGNKSQSQRVRALSAFKQGRSQVLVATDVAARGLDIQALPHVINYELPDVPEDYVHRIGRTGRAGLEGTAISLVSSDEQELMQGIEKLLKRSLEQEVVEGFEPSAAFKPEPIITKRPRYDRGARGGRPRGPKAYGEAKAGRTATFESAPRSHKPAANGSTPPKQRQGASSPGQPQSKSGPSYSPMPGERISGGRPKPSAAQGRQRRQGGGTEPARRSGSGSHQH